MWTIPTWVGVAVAAVAGFLLGGTVAGVGLAALMSRRRGPSQVVIDFRHGYVLDGWGFSCDDPRISGAGYDSLAVAKLAAAQALVARFDVDEPDAALRSS